MCAERTGGGRSRRRKPEARTASSGAERIEGQASEASTGDPDSGNDDRGQTWQTLGEFIRTQRQFARLSLRQMAELARVSNPYLSQVERGLYRPSAEVLKGIAEALHISAETMYAQAGLLDPSTEGGVETAIHVDPHLSAEQKETLIRVYRGFLGDRRPPA
ncbi:MAG: transcriptional regulator [Candidatus Nephthysia bennettiae]|uniref:Helix-turn-helix transcriptional regulator n=1 Tax=Candidatus Nephthysia bennettiae TaxID=3127016 RepID=A0A934K9M8_9BACT|nr:helix-turn-helix transcriptional regulator [Candidatus Dormibacteraeota bacterium]MBJ7614632.1 helix-turn-helix transcriptional regulator [Candidatus Dormibacteraeota bacterium]PZR92448.1 MAG: transcriptional regulator [Candidatus Dormibacteraeota bacterium]